MGSFLTQEDLQTLLNAEEHAFPSPIPTQMISNGEFAPVPQTDEQRSVEARIRELADTLGKRLGVNRRSFLRSAGGMAAAFVAMNEVYGAVFDATLAEAADPEMAGDRAQSLVDQFVFDAQVHFVRDDCKPGSAPHNMLGIRQFAAGYLNPELKGRKHDIEDLKFHNFIKEVYLDSDTDLAILSGAPSDKAEDWFLSNAQMETARRLVNQASGSRRLLAHAVFTPGQPGWLDEVDRAIETLNPDSWKGYTVGDPGGPSEYRWRLDNEELMYPFYERAQKTGIVNICIHKGLLPPGAEQSLPGVTGFAGVDDVGKAAKDWPGLNFIIYHSAFNVLMPTPEHIAAFEKRGQIDWVSELAAIPETFGVNNVFPEIGSTFGLTAIMNPKFCAGVMGTLIKGFGEDNIFWGTDAVWYGSPQWQIEALRRIEIPDEMQKKFGFAPLGPADGMVKSKILGLNSARHYGIDVGNTQKEGAGDKLSALKATYQKAGAERSNLTYGFIAKRI